MGTRSGDLDPGVLVHLLDAHGYDARRLENLVDRRSGLLAISQSTSDMRELLEARASNAKAALAVDMFCRQAAKAGAALVTTLGGLDSFVFTGGIGEHAAPVREAICSRLAHVGVRIDPARNAAHAPVINSDASTCSVRIVTANEELTIARHTHAVLDE
jgi:acetate kinase